MWRFIQRAEQAGTADWQGKLVYKREGKEENKKTYKDRSLPADWNKLALSTYQMLKEGSIDFSFFSNKRGCI